MPLLFSVDYTPMFVNSALKSVFAFVLGVCRIVCDLTSIITAHAGRCRCGLHCGPLRAAPVAYSHSDSGALLTDSERN